MRSIETLVRIWSLVAAGAILLGGCSSEDLSGLGEANSSIQLEFTRTYDNPSNSDLISTSIVGAEEYTYVVVPGFSCLDVDAGSYPQEFRRSSRKLEIDNSILADGPWTACVLARSGREVAEPVAFSWIKDTTPPEGFFITGPTVVSSNATTVTWTEAEDAITYAVSIGRDRECVDLVQTFGGIDALKVDTPNFPNGRYFICMSAFDEAGNSGAAANNPFAFLVDHTPPNTPIAPRDSGAYSATRLLRFEWDAVTDPGGGEILRYEVGLGSEPGGEDLGVYDVGIALNYIYQSTGHGQEVFAKVRAFDTIGNATTWSNSSNGITVDLKVDAAPAALAFSADSASAPAATVDDDNEVYLRWSPAEDSGSQIASYNLIWYDGANCSGLATNVFGLTQNLYRLQNLLDGSYSFRVIAIDAAGNDTLSRCSQVMTVDTQQPAAFIITAASGYSSATPTITWNASEGASSYQLDLTTGSDCSSVQQSFPAVSGTAQTVNELADGAYYLCLQGKDTAGNSINALNTGKSLTIDTQPPLRPQPPTPGASAQQSTVLSYSWIAAVEQGLAGISSYQLRVGTQPGASDTLLLDVGDTLSHSLSVTADGSYYAAVRAKDTLGNWSLWSLDATPLIVDRALDTAPSGVIVAADSAVGGAASFDDDTQLFLRWSGAEDSGSGIASYVVSWYVGAGCSGLSTDTTGFTQQSAVLSGLSEGTFSFAVTAVDAAGNSKTSPCSSTVTIDTTDPAAFNITSSGSVAATDPTLSWTAATGANQYVAILASDSACSSALQQQTSSGTSFSPTALASDTYYFCVTAEDSSGRETTASNSPQTIIVDVLSPAVPAAPAPTNAFSSGVTIGFDWSSVVDSGSAGLAGYELRVGSSPGGNDVLQTQLGNVLTHTLNVAGAGSYYASVRAYDGFGNNSAWSSTSTASVVDDTFGNAPTLLKIADDSISGGNISTDSDLDVFFVWSGELDNESGIASYRVYVYSTNNCTGIPTTYDTNNSYLAFTGLSQTFYTFTVQAFDRAGNNGTSSCSTAVYLDNTQPLLLDNFSAATGADEGSIRITVDFPADTADYDTVTIRREDGAAAPADCSSGTLVSTLGGFADTVVTDTGLTPGAAYSYLLCALDSLSNQTTMSSLNVTSLARTHLIYVSKTQVDGNMGGLHGADQLCSSWADVAGMTGYNWIAMLSATDIDIFERAIIKGPIYNTNNELIATTAAQLWDGGIDNPIAYDEWLNAVTTGDRVITATGSNGLRASGDQGSCTNWTSNAATPNTRAGEYDESSGQWILSSGTEKCSYQGHIYCLSQYALPVVDDFTATTGANSGEVDLVVDLPSEAASFFTKVDIRRTVGNTAPSIDCNSGTLVSTITDFSNDIVNLVDTTTAGATIHYRLCLYDMDSVLMRSRASNQTRTVIAKGSFHYLFVTKNTYSVILDPGGAGAATAHATLDGHCQAEADDVAGLPGTYRGIISSSLHDARNYVTVQGPVKLVTDTHLELDAPGFWTTSIDQDPDREASGLSISSVEVATGTDRDGLLGIANCGDWSDTAGTYGYGLSSQNNYRWLEDNNNTRSCNGAQSLRKFYCLSEAISN